ncbi:SNF2 family domain protein [Toxoplasma gondii RUB]|nr:SNF2 family domain protein [Toxoplasma gondii p89]KFG29483.1 SNF2 family domain protein [Toxoplasma gondii FOU]KFG56498.1 SNF2 family domain protein [Toxoplasma gondii RUB]
MIELVSEIKKKGEKALIFSQYTTYLDVVEESLTTFCGDIGKCRLDGSTAVEDRQALVDDFSTNPDLTIFLLSTKAGGQGLNLTAARTVILMDQVNRIRLVSLYSRVLQSGGHMRACL